jgi:hypothetical protein
LSPEEIRSLQNEISAQPANREFAGHSIAQICLAAQMIPAPAPPAPPQRPPPANPFAGLTAQQLLLARDSLPSSGATTPAASSSASGSRGLSRIPSHQHSHAPSPISSHQPSRAPSRAPTRAASPSQDDDTQCPSMLHQYPVHHLLWI